ncbi:MAG: transglutaminase family protein, partial [Bryobacteraceae bacterium]
RIFEQELGQTIGFVLPLRRVPSKSGTPRWSSQPWFTASAHLFLIPGDSPLGLRLPLESLPWTKPEDVEYSFEADPFATREQLPEKPQRKRHLFTAAMSALNPEPVEHCGIPKKNESAEWISRPALCTQVREGRLYVFMPPVQFLSDYLDLIAAIEDTASYLRMQVTIEGYQPPPDPRISVIKVTPDPGVIEVNVQPAASWCELVGNTTALYDLARQTRLGTEKFMLDGRHSGAGGGNHIVTGGLTPADSPFLRRPDLLRSLIGFWQNHPSLSYLFSGEFIGPTSQHPRVDEARTDSLYEMEIAFDQVPDAGSSEYIAPWTVDRIFRNLLVDLTGNTHRAEICIDKLYPADSASSRLGLVELRAFEMPPHARMSLVQQLLVRALIVKFWKEPYRRKLIHWGNALHDRFMLPHFVELDWKDILQELRDAGYAFKDEWFAPHFEFRFPLIGSITAAGVTVELRHALEPWNVLGEEVTGASTSRSVDSSVERLQVKVTGAVGDRYVVLCNGRRFPQPVGGIRYRAWQPPSCLHPNIPVHTPLVFDIVDTWSSRSIGGCLYHVSHPGGRANEELPVNAQEAESRRLARFSLLGHTPGAIAVPPEESNSEFPLTLDLRRAAKP